MSTPLSQETLATAFAELGVPDPESWAEFEVSTQKPHLARMSVLRSLWNCVSADDDGTQLKEQIERTLRTTRDYPTTQHLLAHCIDRGVTAEVLSQLVRSVEIDLLQRVTYELDGDKVAPSVPNIEWAIFQIGEDGKPLVPSLRVSQTHSSCLIRLAGKVGLEMSFSQRLECCLTPRSTPDSLRQAA